MQPFADVLDEVSQWAGASIRLPATPGGRAVAKPIPHLNCTPTPPGGHAGCAELKPIRIGWRPDADRAHPRTF
jgi:hypothetical protein